MKEMIQFDKNMFQVGWNTQASQAWEYNIDIK